MIRISNNVHFPNVMIRIYHCIFSTFFHAVSPQLRNTHCVTLIKSINIDGDDVRGRLFLSANVNGATCGPFVKQEMISLVLVYHHKGNKDVILKKERCEYFLFLFQNNNYRF